MGGGGGGGATQSMNVGNDCGTSHRPFFGFHPFQNWHICVTTAPIFG